MAGAVEAPCIRLPGTPASGLGAGPHRAACTRSATGKPEQRRVGLWLTALKQDRSTGVSLPAALGAGVVEASWLLKEAVVKSQPFIAPLTDAQIQAHPVCDHGVRRRRDSGAGVDGHGGPFWVFLGCFLLEFLWKVLSPLSLHRAARDGSPGLAQLLIKAGANPNATNKEGMTPLCVAAKEGRPEMARLLVKAGADLNATNKDGTTPLYIAVFLEHGETAKALMDAGAKLAITDKDNVTPLHSAVAKEEKLSWMRARSLRSRIKTT